MRAHYPQEAVGAGHAFQVGLFAGRVGQVHQLGEWEVAHLAKAQRLGPDGVEPAQAISAAGFIARQPKPVACEGRPRELGPRQGVRSDRQADGVRGSGVGHRVFVQGVT